MKAGEPAMKDQSRGSEARIMVVDQEDWCRTFLTSVIKLLGIAHCKLVVHPQPDSLW